MDSVDRQQISRRSMLKAMGAAVAGSALAACAAPAPQVITETVKETVEVVKEVEKVVTAAPPAAEPVTVKFQSAWWVDSATDTLTPACKMFNEKYGPDIQVELINLGTTVEDLLTAMASGTANDVYHNYNFDAVGLFARGVILPIDDLINANQDIFDPAIYAEAQWEGSTYNGARMAVPAFEGIPYVAFCWNKSALDEIGVDPEAAPVTWPLIMDWATKLNKFDDAGNLVRAGIDPLDAMSGFVDTWGLMADGSYISDDKMKFLFDEERFATVVGYIAKVWQEVGPDKMEALHQQWEYWTGGVKSGYANQARVMIINGGWQPGELATSQADKSWENGYTWAPSLDEGKKSMAFGGTHQLLIPKICEHPQEAFTLEAFMTSLEVTLLEYDLRGAACWSKPFVENADFSKYPGLQWFMDSVDAADEIWSPARFSNPIGSEVANLWNRAVQEAIYNQKTPEQALLDINVELQTSLDAFYAAQQQS
jgi:ABC-type glycerol-3-phosphate transport system substrate-binding protein